MKPGIRVCLRRSSLFALIHGFNVINEINFVSWGISVHKVHLLFFLFFFILCRLVYYHVDLEHSSCRYKCRVDCSSEARSGRVTSAAVLKHLCRAPVYGAPTLPTDDQQGWNCAAQLLPTPLVERRQTPDHTHTHTHTHTHHENIHQLVVVLSVVYCQ